LATIDTGQKLDGGCAISTYVYCGQTAGWIKMPLGVEVGLGPGHIVLDLDPAPLPQNGSKAPQFLTYFYCGQTARCIKMQLGTELGLSPGDFVLDGDRPLSKKGAEPPIFGPCLLWPNGCMYQDITWYGGRPQPRRHCVRWGPSCASPKGAQPPNFRPMFVVAKRLDGLRCHLVWR